MKWFAVLFTGRAVPPEARAQAVADLAQAQADRERNRLAAQAAAEQRARLEHRHAQEQHEAAQLAARRRRSQEEIERACRAVGFWFPHDGHPSPPERFSRWRGTFVGRVLDVLGGGGS